MPVFKLNPAKAKTPMPERDPLERIRDFGEVASGYTEDAAIDEALRCARCKDAPCMEGCPVNVKIPQFIEQIACGQIGQAFHIVKETNSLPAICGRVCPQETQCEQVCTRGRNGEPVAIGRLERFAADWAHEHARLTRMALDTMERPGAARDDRLAGMRIACVGSGPASLACAGDLARLGAQVTVFEALHAPGGVLVYGIPQFRLPKELVQREIAPLAQSGVAFEMNAIVGSLYSITELMEEQGFDAVFIGTGAGLPRYMGIEGEDLNGVMVANELLTRVNLMHAYEFPDYATPVYMGKRCVVVGGGNVAMDAARTARRLGAEVTVVYRRGRAEMPARAEEIARAEEEGIRFETLTNPVRAIGNEDGWIMQLECVKMELGQPDESGRRRPVPVKGSHYAMDCDTLVIAIGSRTNPLVANSTDGLERTQHDLIVVDADSCATSLPGVFAGGDATTGAATVIEAMGAGKRAAAGIAQYLEAR